MTEFQFQAEAALIEESLKALLSERILPPEQNLQRFWECMNYSLLSGGKRFRPVLALVTARALDKPLEQAMPLALAVELVHTYSLIHDDLPVMDNDDLRRGKPTNHKVYGDAQALLAGDALLTMAFEVLAESKSNYLRSAVRLLARAAGAIGMVGGQVLDIASQNPDEALLKEIHERKTGALIRVSVEGAAALLGALPEQIEELALYGDSLGLAFQLADDIQDFNPNNPEKINFASRLGVDETKRRLADASAAALRALANFDEAADGLRQMVAFNQNRI